MTTRRATLLQGLYASLGVVASLAGHRVCAQSDDVPAHQPPQLRNWLNAPRLIGQHRLTYWGFEVYDASLWADGSFAPEAWTQQVLVLELRYLRAFKGRDIAQRAIDEIAKQRALSPSQAQNWWATLQGLIPDVRAGERLTGIYLPNKGLQLRHQDRALGELRDAELAERFFGIWLAPETSQRQLRQQLLSGAQT